MKSICFLIFCLTFFQSICAQDTRKPLSEEDQKLIRELKADAKFSTVDCVWEDDRRLLDAGRANRLKAFKIYKSGAGQLKLKQECHGIDGGPVYRYLTVEKGKAFLIIDTSEDNFGTKQVYQFACSDLQIGRYFHDKKTGAMTFEALGVKEIKDPTVFLRCSPEAESEIF